MEIKKRGREKYSTVGELVRSQKHLQAKYWSYKSILEYWIFCMVSVVYTNHKYASEIQCFAKLLSHFSFLYNWFLGIQSYFESLPSKFFPTSGECFLYVCLPVTFTYKKAFKLKGRACVMWVYYSLAKNPFPLAPNNASTLCMSVFSFNVIKIFRSMSF